MPELNSPLAAIAKPGRYGSAAKSPKTGLVLTEHAPPDILQIAGWADFEGAVAPLLDHLGFPGIGNNRTTQSKEDRHLFRLAPDRLWLLSDTKPDLPDELTPAGSLTTLDITHGRWIIEASGPALEDLLHRLAPIDFRESHFPAGTFAQTAIHKTSVLIWRHAPDRARIYCPTSGTHALWSFIADTAAPLGYEVAG
jgi:heterotetrameric sarcosine oxidase gamma subunit